MEIGKKKTLQSLVNINIAIGVLLIVLSVGFLLFILVPEIGYTLHPKAVANEISSIQIPVINEDSLTKDDPDIDPIIIEDDLPAIDENLDPEPKLVIEKIGVNARIREDPDSEVALSKGTWLVPELGDPINDYLPTIIASHRWGLVEWTRTERDMKSFYRLPELGVGDKIQIHWQQRVFEYEVTRNVEATEIDDYKSDLILYTCKVMWQSPVRIFIYAERTN